MLAVFLDVVVHHNDAQACEKNVTRILQTIAEWCRQMVIPPVQPQNIAGGLASWQSVFLTGLEVLRS